MRCFLSPLPLVLCLAPALAAGAEGKPQITFKKTVLDTRFRSEGVAVGDFNRDGKMDIAAGFAYYAAPDWKLVPVVEPPPVYDPHGYSNSFVNAAADLNRDGWTDLIVVDFPGKETWWFENPKESGGVWKRHVCTPVSNNESPQFVDVDGDGKRELLLAVAPDQANSDGPERQMAIVRPQSDPFSLWSIRTISAKAAPGTVKYSHGLGCGDINKDGRNDVLVPEGWWEAPPEADRAEWTFHPAPLGQPAAHMHVYDFDGDGDNDVLSSSAHGVGIWWHEQTPQGWKTHDIDKSFSQTHSLCLADVNGDKLPDFVTGKRWWAHGPTGDVEADQPAVMYWFELTREGGKPVWIPHQFDHDSGVGTQFEVVDVNADGLLDVVTANKKGAHYFQQVRK